MLVVVILNHVFSVVCLGLIVYYVFVVSTYNSSTGSQFCSRYVFLLLYHLVYYLLLYLSFDFLNPLCNHHNTLGLFALLAVLVLPFKLSYKPLLNVDVKSLFFSFYDLVMQVDIISAIMLQVIV